MSYAINKGADQPAHQRSLISAFVVRFLESIISTLAKAKISRLYSVCEVFKKEVFHLSPRCETSSYKYYLIMIKHSFSPKMCRKNFDNRSTNKNLMSKNVFE